MTSLPKESSPSGGLFVAEWENDERTCEAFPEEASARSGRFSGSLQTLAVTDLVQLLQMSKNSARLMLRNKQTEGQLWCANGSIVDAQSGPLRGEAAAFRLLSLQEGWMVAIFGPVTRSPSIHQPLQHLLLESARRKDEVSRLVERLGGLQKVYQRQPSHGETLKATLNGEKSRVFQRLSKATSLEMLLAFSGLGDLETLVVLDNWVRAAVVEDRGLVEKKLTSSVPLETEIESLERRMSSLTPLVSETGLSSAPKSHRKFEPWVWVASALSLLLPLSYGLGHRHQTHPAVSLSAATRAAVIERAPPEATLSPDYEFRLHVAPANAEIWLDGKLLGVTLVKAHLPKDGSTHQVRVTSPGYVPAHIWFQDVAPLEQLQLEKLEFPENAVIKPEIKHAIVTVSTAHEPPKRKTSAKKGAKKHKTRGIQHSRKRPLKRKKRSSKVRNRKRVARKATPVVATNREPKVQVIGEHEPAGRETL